MIVDGEGLLREDVAAETAGLGKSELVGRDRVLG
jgi:hypothetical protein